MEDKNKKCSYDKHKEMNAIYYCQNCKIYMCNKCLENHSKLFKNHNTNLINEGYKEIFTGYCRDKNHLEIVEFFCKNHNKLCCSSCICKIKNEKYGQHTDCEVCHINDIKEKKKSDLKNNIKILEDLSNNINESINKIKILYEKINEKKEELKLKIQKIFTKIRNILNDREDELLLEVEKKYDDLYFKEELIKESEKLPSNIKISLEKGKSTDKEWDNNKLNSNINDCINIENNIQNINIINDNIKKYNNNNNNINIQFSPEEDKQINSFLEKIKNFGEINTDKLLINSLIITEVEEFKLINSWISPNKTLDYQLLYRATRDGDTVNDFHNKCDNKSPILLIGKTPKGFIFGGFTTINLKFFYKDEKLSDSDAFVFSLNQKKKFNSIDKEKAIYSTQNHCIIFGNGSNTLQIENNILKNKRHWSNPNGSYGQDLNLTEDRYFSIIELEVFHVNF